MVKYHKHKGIKSRHPISQEHRSEQAQKYHALSLLAAEEKDEKIEELAEHLTDKDLDAGEVDALLIALKQRPIVKNVYDEISSDTTVLRLVHPGGGTAYALSYKSQKWAEALSGGTKPHIAGIGHYHKIEQLFYRNIHIFQTGTFQAQTPYMSRKQLAAHVGGWIIKVNKNRPFGLIGDTHVGSKHWKLEMLVDFYRRATEEYGVKNFYHTGDIVDGENMYRSQVYEIYAHGLMAQVKAVVEEYPEIEGVKTYYVTGNHDLAYWSRSGADIGKLIDDRRKDLIYLGQEEADIKLYDEPIRTLESVLIPYY